MNDETKLPEGKTCSDRIHLAQCSEERIFLCDPSSGYCDFHPIRFSEKNRVAEDRDTDAAEAPKRCPLCEVELLADVGLIHQTTPDGDCEFAGVEMSGKAWGALVELVSVARSLNEIGQKLRSGLFGVLAGFKRSGGRGIPIGIKLRAEALLEESKRRFPG